MTAIEAGRSELKPSLAYVDRLRPHHKRRLSEYGGAILPARRCDLDDYY